jgi:hypothetical protein
MKTIAKAPHYITKNMKQSHLLPLQASLKSPAAINLIRPTSIIVAMMATQF